MLVTNTSMEETKMAELTVWQKLANNRSCIALDGTTPEQADEKAKMFSGTCDMAKVGKSVHIASEREQYGLCQKLNERGIKIFLDLKLHDTHYGRSVYWDKRCNHHWACTRPPCLEPAGIQVEYPYSRRYFFI